MIFPEYGIPLGLMINASRRAGFPLLLNIDKATDDGTKQRLKSLVKRMLSFEAVHRLKMQDICSHIRDIRGKCFPSMFK